MLLTCLLNQVMINEYSYLVQILFLSDVSKYFQKWNQKYALWHQHNLPLKRIHTPFKKWKEQKRFTRFGNIMKAVQINNVKYQKNSRIWNYI